MSGLEKFEVLQELLFLRDFITIYLLSIRCMYYNDFLDADC